MKTYITVMLMIAAMIGFTITSCTQAHADSGLNSKRNLLNTAEAEFLITESGRWLMCIWVVAEDMLTLEHAKCFAVPSEVSDARDASFLWN